MPLHSCEKLKYLWVVSVVFIVKGQWCDDNDIEHSIPGICRI